MSKLTFHLCNLLFLFLCSFVPLNTHATPQAPELSIVNDTRLGLVAQHGLNKLTEVLQHKHIAFEVVKAANNAQGKCLLFIGKAYGHNLTAQLLEKGNRKVPKTSEALIIWKTNWQNRHAIVIAGYDDKGIMYALLDVANRMSWNIPNSNPLQFVRETTSKPDMKERGIALYTMNRAYWESRFYDEHFWTLYLDMLAQNRFNMLEILFGYENGGFMAPCYPYFFNVEGYPNVKMADITAEQQRSNIRTMNHLIDMAHKRGIGVRLGIWDHIYRGGVQAGGNPDFEYKKDKPLPWQVTGLDSTNLNAYTKAAFAKFLKTFPNLDAILFKTNNESGLKESELQAFSLNFFETVKAISPHLRIDIHGKGLTDTLIHSAIKMGINFRIAPKFWMEQMGLPYSPTHINREDQKNRRHGYADFLRYPQHYQLLWKLWNGGSNRVFLWGDPEYVRRFTTSCHLYQSDAYAVYEPLATKMEAQAHDAKPFELLKHPYYQYEFERYWNFFQTFGLIGYDANTPNDIWDKEFEKRFGEKTAPLIESALHQASWVLPRIVAACYPYSFFPTTGAWPEKQRLGDLPLYAKAEGSDIEQFASFDEEAQVLLGTLETAKTLPSITSKWLTQLSEDVLKKIEMAEQTIGTTENKEFNSTAVDLRMLAYLARYHARRIPAAVNYCLFLRTQDTLALDHAIANEKQAIDAWQQLVKTADGVYTDQILIGHRQLSGHWRDELKLLVQGLEKLKQERFNFKPNGTPQVSPAYQPATAADNSAYFTVGHQPIDSVPQGQAITVQIKINAPAGLKWVHLRYRAVNQYLDFKTLSMTSTANKDTFEATIPANQIDPTYDLMYLVEMMDKHGKGFIYPDLNKETPYYVVHFLRE